MKIRANLFRGHHANRRREQRIQCSLKLDRAEAGLRPEMRHLTKCVDAGIRPARAMNRDSLLRDFPHGVVQSALNGRHAGLRLPAVKIRSVVSDRDFEVSHALTWIIARGGAGIKAAKGL